MLSAPCGGKLFQFSPVHVLGSFLGVRLSVSKDHFSFCFCHLISKRGSLYNISYSSLICQLPSPGGKSRVLLSGLCCGLMASPLVGRVPCPRPAVLAVLGLLRVRGLLLGLGVHRTGRAPSCLGTCVSTQAPRLMELHGACTLGVRALLFVAERLHQRDLLNSASDC